MPLTWIYLHAARRTHSRALTSLCALALSLLGFLALAPVLRAQYTPPFPPSTHPLWFEWTGAAGDGLWGDYGADGNAPLPSNNWWHANPTWNKKRPSIGAHILFGGRAPRTSRLAQEKTAEASRLCHSRSSIEGT